MQVSMSELRHRISILRPVTETDDEGNILSSSVQEVDYRIVIRYRTDVRVTDLILWNRKRLIPIAPPYPLGGKKRWLVIECRELVEDG